MTDNDFQSEAERLRPRLRGVALRYMGDGDAADDVVQDVLLRLWELRPELRPPVEPLAMTMVRNTSISALRRRHSTIAIDGHDYSSQPDDDDRVEIMMRLIDKLKPMQQLVLRLRHISGEEMADIAAMTGMSEVAVRKCLSRARMALRELMVKEMKGK